MRLHDELPPADIVPVPHLIRCRDRRRVEKPERLVQRDAARVRRCDARYALTPLRPRGSRIAT